MYAPKEQAKLPAHVLQARVELGKKLRSMYRSLGWSRADCGKFLHTSERTLRNWETGRHAVPFAAFKLLRIRSYLELPGSAWRGWSISRGKLCTPEGHLLDPHDAAWWSLLIRRAEVGARALRELAAVKRYGEDNGDGDAAARRRDGEPAAAGLTAHATVAAPCGAEGHKSAFSRAVSAASLVDDPMVITGRTKKE